jgi:hypothetical protein
VAVVAVVAAVVEDDLWPRLDFRDFGFGAVVVLGALEVVTTAALVVTSGAAAAACMARSLAMKTSTESAPAARKISHPKPIQPSSTRYAYQRGGVRTVISADVCIWTECLQHGFPYPLKNSFAPFVRETYSATFHNKGSPSRDPEVVMASLPLELHEVLEQEYVSMYGPLKRPEYGELYDSEQIVDVEWAHRILSACADALKATPAQADALNSDATLRRAALAGKGASQKAVRAGQAATDERENLREEIALGDRPSDEEEEKLERAVAAERAAAAEIAALSARREIAQTLSTLVAIDACPNLAGSPALTVRGKLLIEQYSAFLHIAVDRDPVHGAREQRRAIVDEAFSGAVKCLRDIRLENVYSALHVRAKEGKPRTALCISGGGIRSATFALGIIQGLASAGVLSKFDFLSTVSGGGYIGSWLSSWTRRHRDGIAGVEDDLQRADTAVARRWPYPSSTKGNVVYPTAAETTPRELPKAKIDPEPRPVRHLREYSNYMSPRLGLLSADSWTVATIYIRNLLLNLLVLVPILAMLLAWPRLFSYLLARSRFVDPLVLPWIFTGCVAIGFAYIGWSRPVAYGAAAERRKPGSANSRYFIFGVLPLTAAAMALSIFWARAYTRPAILHHEWTLMAVAASVIAMTLLPHTLYYGRYRRALASVRRSGFISENKRFSAGVEKSALEMFAVSVALLTSAALYWLLANKVFYDPLRATPQLAQLPPLLRFGQPSFPQQQFYVCFAVPAILIVFFVQASVFVGLSSRKNDDADREWWGRAGAIALMITAGLALVSFIAVFGPIALYHAPVILGSLGSAAGIGAALLGFSDKTSANQKEEEGKADIAGKLAAALIVPLFVVFLLASISLASTWLVQNFRLPSADTSAMPWSALVNFQSVATHTSQVVSLGKTFELKESIPAAPRVTVHALRSSAHLATIETTTRTELLLFALVGLISAALSWSIGVNKFSMHALYRNRLIRAYLGASRYNRDPDSFTGFDENDNLQMWELRREIIWSSSIVDAASFIEALQGKGELETHIWNALSPKTRALVGAKPLDPRAPDALVQNLNHILMTGNLRKVVDPPRWAAVKDDQLGYSKPFINRAIVDACFPDHIRPMARPEDRKDKDDQTSRPPLHVVNVALNLTSGQDLAWQQRMAESFTITPLHSGSFYLGYRNSREYGGPDGISLGTAVATSGAAASPNMGYHSSPLMAFLLAFFNIRLGSWLGNPGLPGQATYQEAHPSSNLVPLFAEVVGSTSDQSKWVYLSDGGHFENLGLYEMVLRRCHRIVLSDAGADRHFSFEDLGNAIRKIRTDLGVPIDIENMDLMTPRASDGSFAEGRYVARGTIRYSAVDKNAEDGTLIYIKAGIYKDPWVPRDVYNYAKESLAFPHETTADQYFSESQFESYRALGRHAINEISDNYPTQAAADARLEIIAKTFESVDSFIAVAQQNSGPRQKPASS